MVTTEMCCQFLTGFVLCSPAVIISATYCSLYCLIKGFSSLLIRRLGCWFDEDFDPHSFEKESVDAFVKHLGEFQRRKGFPGDCQAGVLCKRTVQYFKFLNQRHRHTIC